LYALGKTKSDAVSAVILETILHDHHNRKVFNELFRAPPPGKALPEFDKCALEENGGAAFSIRGQIR
jgi:hypothetical protein